MPENQPNNTQKTSPTRGRNIFHVWEKKIRLTFLIANLTLFYLNIFLPLLITFNICILDYFSLSIKIYSADRRKASPSRPLQPRQIHELFHRTQDQGLWPGT